MADLALLKRWIPLFVRVRGTCMCTRARVRARTHMLAAIREHGAVRGPEICTETFGPFFVIRLEIRYEIICRPPTLGCGHQKPTTWGLAWRLSWALFLERWFMCVISSKIFHDLLLRLLSNLLQWNDLICLKNLFVSSFSCNQPGDNVFLWCVTNLLPSPPRFLCRASHQIVPISP